MMFRDRLPLTTRSQVLSPVIVPAMHAAGRPIGAAMGLSYSAKWLLEVTCRDIVS